MDRRSFLKLSPAFPVGAVTAALVLREEGKEDVSLDISVLKAEPGDVIVLSAPGYISQDTAERLKGYIEHRFPKQTAIIMGDGLKVDGIIRNT